MMLQPQPISYRNGLYQGSFSSQTNSRSGFGLAFTTDNHLTIGSTWNENQINDASFIYYNHAHYVYGFWKMSMPHGFNAVKMGHCVIFAWFQRGVLQGRFLVVYEQYDTVVVLEKRRGDPDGEFIEIQKGDVFSDQDLNQYIQLCNWPEFEQSWKTLIKFLSTKMTSQQNKFQPKLQLLNHTYYRYGYSQGLAIIFDDNYNIISAGLHNKANLKSLGIKFTKQKFVEEGNFNNQNQIYAFNYGNRPEIKIGKLYNQYLLKSVQFVNQFISNPAQLLIQYMEAIVNSNLMRKVMAGQITNRKIEGLGSPQGTDRSRQSQQITSARRQKEETPRLEEYRDIKKEEQKKKLRQQKLRLQLYRRQIYESINRKSDVKQIDPQAELEPKLIYQKASPQTQIITKPPVEMPIRTSHRNQIYQRNQRTQTLKNKSRSPIFTPQKYNSNSRSVSPSTVSPFKQKIRSKIFKYDGKTDLNQIRASQRKKYVYQTIAEDLYPRHTYEIGNYNSPHQELEFSRSRGTVNEQVVPLSMRKQVLEQEQYMIKNSGNEDMKMKIKVNAAQQSNPQMYNQDKKKIRYLKKSENPISFRDENAAFEPRRQNTQTGIGNIVMNSPYMKKSPSIRKIPRQQPPPPSSSPSPSPYRQNPKKQAQDPSNRRNLVYLKQQPQLTSQSPNKKQIKQIKGQTYLQKYNKSKNVTPQKVPKIQNELKNYNKTIRNFNQNNRMYDIIQSPEKNDIKNVRNDVVEDVVGGKGSGGRDVTPSKKKYQYVFN